MPSVHLVGDQSAATNQPFQFIDHVWKRIIPLLGDGHDTRVFGLWGHIPELRPTMPRGMQQEEVARVMSEHNPLLLGRREQLGDIVVTLSVKVPCRYYITL